MKKFLDEFKAFAMKGNVLDMAIGVIIGSAFSGIVTSLVNDIFMPLVALLTGDVNFAALKLVLKGEGDTAVSLNYGSFIQTLVNFLIVAFCLFLFVRFINRLKEMQKKEEEEKKEEPKESEELKVLKEILEEVKKN